MFENYTPEARRAIFFSHEASKPASLAIDAEHLLLGLVREDVRLLNRFLTTQGLEDAFRNQIIANATLPGAVRTFPVDLRFSGEAKRVLELAEEEASRMGCQQVGLEHLLLGLLCEKGCSAARILCERGADIESMRRELVASPYQPLHRSERVRREVDQVLEMVASAPTQPAIVSSASNARAKEFERYTVKAHRLLFFAMHQASRLGSPRVESGHLLLAVLREEKEHFKLFLPFADSREAVYKEIEEQAIREGVFPDQTHPSHSSPPLSDEVQRIQAYAEEEAKLLGSTRIGPVHLLLGMLREEGCHAARFLRERGAEIASIRRGLASHPKDSPQNPAG